MSYKLRQLTTAKNTLKKKKKQAQGCKERQIQVTSSTVSFLKCVEQAGLCQAEVRSPEPNLALPREWQGPKY